MNMPMCKAEQGPNTKFKEIKETDIKPLGLTRPRRSQLLAKVSFLSPYYNSNVRR